MARKQHVAKTGDGSKHESDSEDDTLDSLNPDDIIASAPDAPLLRLSSAGASETIWLAQINSFLSGLPHSIAEGSLRQISVGMKCATEAGDEARLWRLNEHHEIVLSMFDFGCDGPIKWTEEQEQWDFRRTCAP